MTTTTGDTADEVVSTDGDREPQHLAVVTPEPADIESCPNESF